MSRTPSPPHSYRCPRFFCTLNLKLNCSTGSQRLLVEVGLGLAALPPWDGKTREIQGDFKAFLSSDGSNISNRDLEGWTRQEVGDRGYR